MVPQAEKAARNCYADKIFLGVRAILVDESYLADVFELEANLKKVTVNSAYEVILVAESWKLQEVAFFKICESRKVAGIFTDDRPDPLLASKFEDVGIQVTKVRVDNFSPFSGE